MKLHVLEGMEAGNQNSEVIHLIGSDGDHVIANRQQLEAVSDYFYCLFRSGMQETQSHSVTFSAISSSILQICIDFVSNDENTISLVNVEELLVAAIYLQMSSLKKACEEFLISTVSLDNYNVVYHVAAEHHLDTVKKVLLEFMYTYLPDYSETTAFASMKCSELCEILNSSCLNISYEIEVLEIVSKWMNTHMDEIERDEDVLEKLLKCIRIPSLYADCSDDVVKMLEIVNDFAATKAFLKILNNFKEFPYISHPLDDCQYDVRKGINVVALIGGIDHGIWKTRASHKTLFISEDKLCHAYTSHCGNDSQFAQNLTLLDKNQTRMISRLYEHSVCVHNNYLFIAGGQTDICLVGRYATAKVNCFDTRGCEWRELCSMSTARFRFYLGASGDNLYAVGGVNEEGHVLSCVECYSSLADKWRDVAPLPTKLCLHAGCCHGEHVYISGGHDGTTDVDSLYRYTPQQDGWEMKGVMRQGRSRHSMLAIQNSLVVLGGCNEIDLADCERYDIETDQWTMLTSLPKPTSYLSTMAIGRQIWCLGGCSWLDSQYTDTAQCYDMDKDEWKVIPLPPATPKRFVGTQLTMNELRLFVEDDKHACL